MRALNNHLVVSEQFYSIQGEGACLGMPAVFLRLAGCNLRCLGFSYRDPATGEHLGCDTKAVWRSGNKLNFHEIIEYWQAQGWLDKLNNGAHLIITGGEPLIQQASLVDFIKQLDFHCKPFIEIETNATIKPVDFLMTRITQFNVSPKLSNSGETQAKAYHPEVLATFSNSDNAHFKFVISTQQDVDEVIKNFVQPLQLQPKNIWLMPEGGTAAEITEKQPWLVERCKQHLFNFTPRLQVAIWGEVTGV